MPSITPAANPKETDSRRSFFAEVKKINALPRTVETPAANDSNNAKATGVENMLPHFIYSHGQALFFLTGATAAFLAFAFFAAGLAAGFAAAGQGVAGALRHF